jgi:hypothetical protein
MSLFRHDNRPSGQRLAKPTDHADDRPAWMRDGAKAVLLDGHEDLSVVGESSYQDNLWRLAPARPGGERVHTDVTAVLVAEEGDPHDSNAIAVWINGLKTGHLSREDAARYRPGLLALQQVHGMPVALSGFIAGGGMRDDGPGRLGVFLRHDPADFGLPPRPGADALRHTVFGLSAADLDDARMTYVSNYNHRSMNSGRGDAEIVTVIRTGMFQDPLRQAAAAPRPWRHEYDRHLPAILAPVPGDPAAVAVLIDGTVVGYLSQDIAERHREQLDDLARAGQYLVCSALIVGGDAGKSFGIRLQVKPGIGTRWAAGARP